MASKKATVFILNVGHSMSEDFSTALSTIIEVIEDKVIIGRKTDMVSVLLAGTAETENVLNDETPDQYEHISVLSNIGQPTLDLLRKLQNVCTAKETDPKADVLDAVIVAIQMIVLHCRKLKYQKKIVLFTDAEEPIDWDDLEEVGAMLETNDISLIVVGSNYEAYESSDTENLTETMSSNYKNWNALVKYQEGGEVMSLAEAYENTQTDYAKEVRPTPSYRGMLYLGDPLENSHPEKYTSSSTDNNFLAIPIHTFLRTKPVPLPSLKKYAPTDDTNMDVDDGDFDETTQKASHKVTWETKLAIEDTKLDEDGNELDTEETEITKEEVDKAFKLGSTAVKIPEEALELEKQNLNSRKQMSILRFIPKKEFPRSYLCSHATVIMPGKYSHDEANLALKSLAYAMSEDKVLALVRYVYKDGASPMLGVLDSEFVAETEETPETFVLHYFETTFAEDIRNYIFLRLRLQDTDPQLETEVEHLIDAMELDDIGESYLVPDNVYNGQIWRIHKAIKTRALNREAPIPDVKESAKAIFKVDEQIIEKASSIGEEIANIAKVKEVKKKGKKKSRAAEQDEPELTAEPGQVDDLLSKTATQAGFGGDSLTGATAGNTLTGSGTATLAGPSGSGSSGSYATKTGVAKRVERVGLDTPVQDFNAILEQPSDEDPVISAMTQMMEVINELLKISFGNQYYAKCIDCLKALRHTAIDDTEPLRYNAFVRELKKWCDLKDKYSPHREFWDMMKKNKLGLITNEDSPKDPEVKNITPEMGEEFWNEKDTEDRIPVKKADEHVPDFEEDLDDLI